MNSRERDKQIKHWERVIKRYERMADDRGFSLSSERQEIAFAHHQIEEIRKQWSFNKPIAVYGNNS